MTHNDIAGHRISNLARMFSFFSFIQQSNQSELQQTETEQTWPDDTSHDTKHYQTECGGYNEAFVMQQWASFNPHQ